MLLSFASRYRIWSAVGVGLLLGANAIALAADEPAAAAKDTAAKDAEISVGIDTGEIRGSDNRALQAAVDHVARLGGGTVHIGPGRYEMRNALTLRDRVRVTGVPGKTILAACDGINMPLVSDGDCYERQITLQDASGFRIGDGVSIQDDVASGGFLVTTATLLSKVDDRTFKISNPLYYDYLVKRKASARLAFPIIGLWNAKHVVLEGLTIDGNSDNAQLLGGCRGGGIYLFESEDVTIRNCHVKNYRGDGISFQVSHQVTIEDCVCENNTGVGLHPGSGSQRPVIRRCRTVENGGDGIFVCWRVKHGIFEQNEISHNQGLGISIGHKDTDNLFRDNTIASNGKSGLLFRPETEPMGAHRNVFENNRFLDNGLATNSDPPAACIVIQGQHHDLNFRGNTIGFTRTPESPAQAITIDEASKGLRLSENDFRNVRAVNSAVSGK